MDEVTFSDLYRTERAAMIGLATVLLGSRRLADDVVHDAFANVWQRFDQLESPGGYLRTSVVNGCYDARRRQAVASRFAPDLIPRNSELPADVAELADGLAQLPERQRAVLVLRYLLDWSDRDIAAALGCSRPTVRSYSARGLRALRKYLSKHPIER